MHQDVEEIVLTEEQLAQRIAELGKQITEDYADVADEGIVLLVTLRGAVIFAADLARSIELPIEVDFVGVSSYGNATTSSGIVRVTKDLSSSVENRHVIVVEDIVDSGRTLEFLIPYLHEKNPASVSIACLLKKTVEGQKSIDCKYIAFDCPNAFIVGYGLDYAQRYRNLPYIGILKPEVYQK